MIDDKKSTDPGLSAAERKTLRSREAEGAIADHEEAQKAFHENREHLRKERLRREAAAGPMLYWAYLPASSPGEYTALGRVAERVGFELTVRYLSRLSPLIRAIIHAKSNYLAQK